MKVVVYLRQIGGIAAKDYAVNTHWTEDENEIPVALFSFFDLADVDLPAEILAQLAEANPWLEARRGVVSATFTEIEDGSSRRPAYGAARKAAIHHRAVLLVATTGTMAGQAFDPTSQDGVEVVTLQDPQKRDREQWARSRDVVIYLRAGEPGIDTDTLLSKQRRELSKMTGSCVVLAELVEDEHQVCADRPMLAKALEMCRQHRARLLIGTTDAIAPGETFLPDFADVPYDVAYRREFDWPDLISVAACPYAVALMFGRQSVRGNVPVYLANNTEMDFASVTVTSQGSALAGGVIVETTMGSKSPSPIPVGHARLIEAYDIYFDGDFLTEYRVDAQLADGTRFIGRAMVKDIPFSRWVEVAAIRRLTQKLPR